MTMWFHLTAKATGEKQIVEGLSNIDADLFDITELDHEPTQFEDVIDGKIVRNGKREADTVAGASFIAEARGQKRIEALLIASGITLTGGLLNAEATARVLLRLCLGFRLCTRCVQAREPCRVWVRISHCAAHGTD